MKDVSTPWNAERLVGLRLGSCVLERPLGIGGMGAVYLARQERPWRQVAVKVLRRAEESDPRAWAAFLARFRREADATAALDHTHIVPVYAFGEEDQTAYLVMPYLSGGSLQQLLERSGALALHQALPLVAQIAAALDYAHSRGVIHRDVKPSNVLRHGDGRLLLADFGIARLLDRPDAPLATLRPGAADDPALTVEGAVLGTPHYMAPEQIAGAPVGPAVDIYALGALTYTLLTGVPPHDGARTAEVLRRAAAMSPLPLRARRPDLPTSVEDVLTWALSRTPSDRPRTAGTFARALQSATTSAAASGTTAPRAARTARDGAATGQMIEPDARPPALVAAPLRFGDVAGGAGGAGQATAQTELTETMAPGAPTLVDGTPGTPGTPGTWGVDSAHRGGGGRGGGGAPVWPGAAWPAPEGHVPGPNPGPGTRRRARGRALLLAMGVVLLLVLACGTLAHLGQAGRAPGAQAGVATRPTATATSTPTPLPTATATPTPPLGWLTLSLASVRLGCDAETASATLDLSNTGAEGVLWYVSAPLFAGVAVSPGGGWLSAGRDATITVTSARDTSAHADYITFKALNSKAGQPALLSFATDACPKR